jgi:hypothetical protein
MDEAMKRIGLVLASVSMICLSGTAQAIDSGSRYQSWQPPAGETVQMTQQNNQSTMQNMIDELNQLIDDADKARAADRNFIQDLRDVVNQYDWPWRKTLLEEDFTDGYLETKSQWKIIAGDYKLKRGLGLHSNIVAQEPTSKSSEKLSDEEAAAALIGAIFNQAMKTKKNKPDDSASKQQYASNASIISKTTVTNAFAIKLDIDVRSQQGEIEIGVYQGQPHGNGYRLVFLPGPSASIEVQRIGSRGTSIIDVADKVNAKGDKVHQILWTRSKQGNMTIKLNDNVILKLADRTFKDKFNGVIINNEGGEFALQRMTIQGG